MKSDLEPLRPRTLANTMGTSNPTEPELFLHLLEYEGEFPDGLVKRESLGSAACATLREILESKQEERKLRVSDILLQVDVEDLERAELLPSLLPFLLRNLDSTDSQTAFMAAEKVGQIRDRRAIPKLINLTRRTEGAERMEAVIALES